MRIIAGSLKGRRLKAPTWDGLRPTSDKLRETLFNILAPRIAGARVLDGYAGTGALGIEALSRGAAGAVFVEQRSARADADRREPSRTAAIEDRCAIIRATARRALRARCAVGPVRHRAARSACYDPAAYERARRSAATGGADRRARRAASRRRTACSSLERRGAGAPVRDPAPERLGQLRHRARSRVRRHDAGVLRVRHAHERTGRAHGSPSTPDPFDPLTNGHVDIIARGARLFDRIIVAILVNAEKSPLFTMDERVEIAREVFTEHPNVEVDTFDGLLVDYVERRQGAR